MGKAGKPIPFESDLADFVLDELGVMEDEYRVDVHPNGVKVYRLVAGGLELLDKWQLKMIKERFELSR